VEQSSNTYCEKLAIPVPCVEDAMQRPGVKLFHLMVVALLEAGEPLGLLDIVVRLTLAGVDAPSGDLEMSLKKAWHGKEPVYRLPDGRYGLTLDSHELEHVLWMTGSRPEKPRQPLPELAPEPSVPGDDQPLGSEELAEALRSRRPPRFSELRLAAAVLDTKQRPMTLSEVSASLMQAAGSEVRLYSQNPRYWAGRLLAVDAEGRMHLEPGAPEIRQVRRMVRETLRATRRDRALEEQREAAWKAHQASREEEERQAARVAEGLRRAVLRVVPEPDSPHAVAILDESARSIRTFVGKEIGDVPAVLRGFDLIAGLFVRDTLHALGSSPLDGGSSTSSRHRRRGG
jgi:hypothetical protein